MTTRILDASVALAWYLPESFAAAARLWQRRLLGEEIRFVVPSLHFWEVANVLRTRERRGELDATLAEEIYDLHLAAPLEVVEPERGVVLRVALEYGATAYDAVYIALAQELGAPLVTAEKTTTPWVVRLGDMVEGVR